MTGPQQPGDWHLHDHREPPPQQTEDPGATNQGWALPTDDSRVPGGRRPLTSRGRSWLLFVTAACLVLIYVVVWAVYADTHMRDRYVQVQPGQPSATTLRQAQYRVHSLVKTERINDPGRPDEPQIAEAGTIFVVAEVEVLRIADDESFACTADLAVDGVRRIAAASDMYLDDLRLPTSCTTDDTKVGHPYRFLAMYRVPTRFADRIYGIAVEYPDPGAPYQVIRPPA